jgi:hypothetical protein
MIVMLVFYHPLPRLAEIYRTLLAWRCMYAHVSDVEGSYPEISSSSATKQEDFIMSAWRPSRRKNSGGY